MSISLPGIQGRTRSPQCDEFFSSLFEFQGEEHIFILQRQGEPRSAPCLECARTMSHRRTSLGPDGNHVCRYYYGSRRCASCVLKNKDCNEIMDISLRRAAIRLQPLFLD
ncbi:uncharacterized protein NECHADRAFT_79173 [Fusarium vanettenii 77-13-4]|uniref:Uncharacterized protein n=1 Tax=Fusarium vanettenii (strain ATCC MYA-4622 / CBS 123669 / FGSC 9596 / NRRL 45880 / 77-13-4) TaxID=660122 RepID=C7YQP1_FUSV7|nr:uncharacterized protein NECHADRAFT_79173 [Fusarium vanettenii 77-13-4]EEU46503.1 predicted protein [Fusarium vanettenii 77-13-4]